MERNLAGRVLIVIGKLLAIAFFSSIGMGVVFKAVTVGYATLVGGEKQAEQVGAFAGLIAWVALIAWLSWLFFRAPRPVPGLAHTPQDGSKSSGLEPPPLLAVKRPYTGETIEQALARFEDACSEEIIENVTLLESRTRPDGTLVRYTVHWKPSIFDDYAYYTYEAWALLRPPERSAELPPDARFQVVAVTAERHNL